jgi:butyrate kinase
VGEQLRKLRTTQRNLSRSWSTVVCGEVDEIILTGGCAYSKILTDRISERVKFIAPVTVVPGAKEMKALQEGITRVLDGKENYHIYGE